MSSPKNASQDSKDSNSIAGRLAALEVTVKEAQQEVRDYHEVLTTFVASHEMLSTRVEKLQKRISELEEKEEAREKETFDSPSVRRGQLRINVPKFETNMIASRGPTTPVTARRLVSDQAARSSNSSSPEEITNFPITPRTPLLNRQQVHNLSENLPPANVELPLLPLTDQELIIFFFNCTNNPLVALRLKAREWGPARITELINKYRIVKPKGYSRNTCSVRLTGSIRRGVIAHGNQWIKDYGEFFEDADDCAATDAILPMGPTKHAALEYRVLDFKNESLKSLPTEEDGAGIFTECLKWCIEHREEVDVMLSDLHIVAMALRHGQNPILSLDRLEPYSSTVSELSQSEKEDTPPEENSESGEVGK